MLRLCRFLLPCAASVLVGATPAGAVPVYDVTVVAGAGSAANDLNDRGEVVGSMASGSAAHAFLFSGGNLYPNMAFLYENGMMRDLNALSDPASGWEITNAAAINDVGQIAATACKGGLCHAARLDHVPAVPEPSVLALLGGGLALLGWRRRQAWGFTPLAPRCPG